MMKSFLALIALLFLFFGTGQYDADRAVPTISFYKGEILSYKVHYGFLNAAVATMTISDNLYNVNGFDCYKIEVFGRSVGMFDLFLRIRDTWGTYMDSSAMITRKFYRKIEEGKYRKHEIVEFDQDNQIARVRTFDKRKKLWKPVEVFDTPACVQDLVSGYYYLRTLDFSTIREGETVKVAAFFDDEVYDFSIRFDGRETIKTKLGRLKSLKLTPIMPDNELFDGENSIQVWLSDDVNKVPLKIKADMFVGAVEVDITNFEKGIM
ncbi:MAG: DUF3108 domain-containing protein [Bacteroidota bacterium]